MPAKKGKTKKGKAKRIVCKKCGESWGVNELEPKKEWQKVAPMPDKEGNVTIVFMASWSCPKCGKGVIGSRGKTKGEMKGKSKRDILVEELRRDPNQDLEVLVEKVKVSRESLEKIVPLLIQKEGLVRDV